MRAKYLVLKTNVLLFVTMLGAVPIFSVEYLMLTFGLPLGGATLFFATGKHRVQGLKKVWTKLSISAA
jgi:hypothetical protein